MAFYQGFGDYLRDEVKKIRGFEGEEREKRKAEEIGLNSYNQVEDNIINFASMAYGEKDMLADGIMNQYSELGDLVPLAGLEGTARKLYNEYQASKAARNGDA